MPPQGPGSKAAACEDWDSDESSAVPGTLVQAAQPGSATRKQQQPRASSRAPKLTVRTNRKDAASDSGYSSHASASLATSNADVPDPIQPPAPRTASMPPGTRSESKTRSKPVIHRTDSARDAPRPQVKSESSSPSKQIMQCSDPHCRDPNCKPSRTHERRYAVPSEEPRQRSYRSTTESNARDVETYSARVTPSMELQQSQPGTMGPPPIPRRRSDSMNRPRPISIHGYPPQPYGASQHGPPPSASAYYHPQQYPQQYPPPSPSYLGSTPPMQMPDYSSSPVQQIPPSPTQQMTSYAGFPGFSPAIISARQVNPMVPGLDIPRATGHSGLTRSMSARRPQRAVPDHASSGSDCDSLSSYDSESSEVDRRYPRRRLSRRDSRPDDRAVALVLQSNRPTMRKKYYTEPPSRTRSRHDSRPDVLRRSSKYDDYPSSSEFGDSDRTARAVITRDVVEAPNGRRASYYSKERQDDLIRRTHQLRIDQKLEDHRLQEERIAAYQKDVGGGGFEPHELTAENMRKKIHRKSGSQMSGRSHRSAGSGSREGVQIRNGETVLHVHGDAQIEMQTGEDGVSKLIIAPSASGRDSTYRTTSSRSSSSRTSHGRVLARSRRQLPINEYEEAL